MEFKTLYLEELIRQIKTISQHMAGDAVISIDGVCGVGRQIVARELSAAFGWKVIRAEGMPDHRLSDEVSAQRLKGPVIVEGPLMRRRFSDCTIRADIAVYVVPARESAKYPVFEGILFRGLNDFLKELKDNADKELVKYHHTLHPIVHADFIVQDRVEGG